MIEIKLSIERHPGIRYIIRINRVSRQSLSNYDYYGKIEDGGNSLVVQWLT